MVLPAQLDTGALSKGLEFWGKLMNVPLQDKRDSLNILFARKGMGTSTDVPNRRELRVLCKCLQHEKRVEMKMEVLE